MAEGEGSKGITGFLGKDTAGLPNWAWLLVVGAGLAAAYVLPKLFGNSSSSSTSGTSSTDSTGNDSLAVDPTTGLPYNPAGAFAGGIQGPAGPAGPPGPQGPPGVSTGGTTIGTTTGTTGVECPGAIRACPAGYTPTYSTGADGCPAMTCMPTGTTSNTPTATATPSPVPLAVMTSPAWPGQSRQVRVA